MKETTMPRSKERPTTLRQTFCDNLKKTRRTLGITQMELAKRMGISRPYISDMERGRNSLTLDQVERVSKALNVTPVQLLRKRRRMPKSA